MNQQDVAKKLAADHWAYIESLLRAHGGMEKGISAIGFHYRTAMIHGFKHGVEWEQGRTARETWAREVERKMTAPLSNIYLHGNLCPSCTRTDCAKGQYPATSDGGCEGYIPEIDHVALEAELDRSCGDPAQDAIHVNRAVTRLSKCPTCYDHKQCGGSLINAKGDCLHHRPKPKAERKASLCHSCHAVICSKEFIAACEETGTCAHFVSDLRERMLDAKGETVATAKQDAPKTDEPATAHTDPATNCKDCADLCFNAGKKITLDYGCEKFTPKGGL